MSLDELMAYLIELRATAIAQGNHHAGDIEIRCRTHGGGTVHLDPPELDDIDGKPVIYV